MIAKIAIRASYLLLFILISLTGKSQLKADFNSNNNSGCSPLLIQFSDLSTGNPTEWKWELGNGTTSFLQNPSVTYFTPGSYTVKLIIKKGNKSDTIVKPDFITVHGKPVVDFFANSTSGCYPLPVNFSDSSDPLSGTISKWEWDFGDGNNSGLQNPEHTYTNPGNYNVTLRVTNSTGCVTTLSKTTYIKINSGVTANFTTNDPSVCAAPVSFDFQNLSAGTGTLDYVWEFGDGTSSTDENPRHIYANSGDYSVKLLTVNSGGCKDSITKSNLIQIGNVKAGFTTDNKACPGNVVILTNTSKPAPSSVIWDFGDGTFSTNLNPTKIYTTSGLFQIKLISNFNGCTDSAFRKITILPKPTAAFTADKTSSCKIPFSVNFTNQSTGGVSYKWYFGDGDSSASSNPSHVYNKEGNYNVKLITTNVNGCTETVEMSSYIQIIFPKLQILNAPDSGCAPFTKQLAFSSNMLSSLTNFKWDFGDGEISTDASPLHTFVNPGRYTLALDASTADGCTATTTKVKSIIASELPHSMFSADPRDPCAEKEVTFTDESTGGASKWLWDFGDGTSSEQNPKHIYSDTGYFDVQLIVWNGGCPDTLKVEKYIYIKAPIAKFVTVNNCSNPLVKTFTDKSIGADTWNWDFGDGTLSTVKSPVHTYAAPGNYDVNLTVFNNTTGCSFTTSQNIPVVITKANFYASDTIICKNNLVTFSVPAANRNFVSSFEWNLGDGLKRNSPTGTITFPYPQAGTYDIRLIITNTLGCKDTLLKSKYLQVFGPTAKFETAVSGACLNSTVSFTDKTVTDGVHAIDKWIWTYGDGQTDTIISLGSGRPDSAFSRVFEHTYNVTGLYTIVLQTVDSKGCIDKFSIPTPLIIAQPKADFVTFDTLSCPGKPISFTNSSTGINPVYTWDFGDINSSTEINPTHLYPQDGLYTVKLTVTDKFGCKDSASKTNYVNIVLPTADFIMSDSVSTCPPMMVFFTDKSKNTVNNKVWDFGDSTFSTIDNPSHFYTYPGTYIVKQTITGPGGCTDTKEKTIVIRGPRGAFTYNPLIGCNPIKIDFVATTQDRTSFIWDFSDGTTLTTKDSLPSHSYTFFGEYIPKMILVDAMGCSVAITGTDTIKVNGAEAKFKFDNKLFCDSGLVSFTDSSSSFDKIVNFDWNFGDGALSTDQNAQHSYTKSGSYTPQLVITTENGCTDTLKAKNPIKIVSSPKIGMSSIFNGCVPLDATYKGIILAPDTSSLQWNWSLGNGNTSSLQNPAKQFYNTAGVYDINLTVTNSSGCFDTLHRTIEAYPIPKVGAGIDTLVCKGKGIQINASGATTYIWKNTPGLSCLTCPNPTATPSVETRYFVTGTSAFGCTDTSSVVVKVKYPFKMQVGKGDTLCVGLSAKISASGAYSYVWSPAAGLNNSVSEAPTAKPDTTTTYRVIGTDDRNCFYDTGYVRIKVYPIPTVDAGEDKTINVGQTITLMPKISTDVTKVDWNPTIGLINRVGNTGISIKPKETTEYTVEVKNPGGCTSQDKLTIFVVCNGANIFMPNTFSPNGDGVNDVYYPRGTGIFRIKSLRIFNRWGEMVYGRNSFKANDAAAGWDGRYNGGKLNSDVFVYTLEVVCENNEVLTFKGNIALIN